MADGNVDGALNVPKSASGILKEKAEVNFGKSLVIRAFAPITGRAK